MEKSDIEVQLGALTVEETMEVCADENEEIKLLPGYRFNPFDYELIVYYLLKKVNKQPLPHNKIVEVKQLYKFNPEDITKTDQGLGENEWYFFTERDGECANGDGNWKATEDEKTVYYEGVVVGHRKELVFYRGKVSEGDKTDWIMHEFRLAASPSTHTCQDDKRLDDWVLCRIYRKSDTNKIVPKEIHNENSASKIGSPIGIPTESHFCELATETQLPTPFTSDFGYDVEEFYSHIFHGDFDYPDDLMSTSLLGC